MRHYLMLDTFNIKDQKPCLRYLRGTTQQMPGEPLNNSIAKPTSKKSPQHMNCARYGFIHISCRQKMFDRPFAPDSPSLGTCRPDCPRSSSQSVRPRSLLGILSPTTAPLALYPPLEFRQDQNSNLVPLLIVYGI